MFNLNKQSSAKDQVPSVNHGLKVNTDLSDMVQDQLLKNNQNQILSANNPGSIGSTSRDDKNITGSAREKRRVSFSRQLSGIDDSMGNGLSNTFGGI